GVVRAKAGVELRIEPLRRRRAVTFARAGEPPAADLDRPRPITHVDDSIELVVVRMPRLKICGTTRHVHELAVDEPQRVHAARMRPGSVEMGNERWSFRHADIEQVETRGRQTNALRLIG